MKPSLLLLLLNLGCTLIALAIYDAARSDDTDGSGVIMAADPFDSSSLEKRIAALEGARRPTLQATGDDRDLRERVTALEAARTEAKTAAPIAGPASADAESTPRAPLAAVGEEITDDEIARFQEIRDAARDAEKLAKTRAWIHKSLGQLALRTSRKEREEIARAFVAFKPRIDEIWTQAKIEARATVEAGGTIDRKEIVTNTSSLIQQSFADTLSGVVGAGDAAAIASALIPIGRGGK